MKTRAGFTLVELLVVVAIIAVCAAIALPVIAAVQASGRRTAEISAGRQLMAGYLAYAAENDGQLLPGYAALPAKDHEGRDLGYPVAYRYPWRLAPYLNYEMAVLYGRADTDRLTRDRARPPADFAYSVSVTPAFGINGAFVGGDSQFLNPDSPKVIAAYGDFCVRRLATASRPSLLVVFATACSDDGTQRVPGYFKVEPPRLTARRWSTTWKGAQAEPGDYGQVDFRHGGKAIAALLDGHVELLDFDGLNDMRRWSNQAAEADQRDFPLGRL